MVKKYYRRYTELPSLIHMLAHRELTMLDPRFWDDKNDANFFSLYREKCKLRSALALCFTQATETYHHWRVFAPGSAGVCVQFNGEVLQSSVQKVLGLRLKPVKYLKVDELKRRRVTKTELPFLKRFPYRPEKEVRLLWQSKTVESQSLSVPFELSAIARITLSPWLHPSLTDGVRSLLKSIDGCNKLKIYRSTLISNAAWMKYGGTAT